MNDLPFIIPNWPAPANVKALQTTRNGGLSLPPYASLNLGGHVNDDPLAVAANRQLLSPFLPSEPVWVNQVHGTRVIDAAQSGCLEDADASFANIANVVCVTMTADCLPVLLCDRSGSVVAAVHAGWRGLCDGVIEAAITNMAVQPPDILAWLGPAIGPQAFEVGPEVRQQFIDKEAEAEIAFSALGNKWLCDIYAIAQQRLRKAGVSQIYGGGINENFCTYTDKARFFSYRRDQITGRMASLIWLQPA
jgi:YfiH family protein